MKNNIKNKIPSNPSLVNNFSAYLDGNELKVFISLLLIMILIVFSRYIFGGYIYLFSDIGSDSINLYYPNWVLLSEYAEKGNWIVSWTFQQGMGQNISSVIGLEPFTTILILSGKSHIPSMIIWLEVAKVFLNGLLFFLYLREMKIKGLAQIIGSLSYAFIGYMILCGSGWFNLSSTLLYFTLMMFGFERIVNGRSMAFMVLGIFFIAVNATLNLYFWGLFLTVYIIFRFFDEFYKNPKIYFVISGKAILSGILGIGMAAIILVPDLMELINSPRLMETDTMKSMLKKTGLFELSQYNLYLSTIYRLFSTDMIGTGDKFTGWINYFESPILYFGLINLLMFPMVFSGLEKRKKILYLIVLLFIFLFLIFPYLRYTYFLFNVPYWRQLSVCLVYFLLIFSIKAFSNLEKIKKINKTQLFISLGIILLILVLPYPSAESVVLFKKVPLEVNTLIQITAIIFLLIYAVLISLYSKNEYRNNVKFLLLLTVVLELTFFSAITVNYRTSLTTDDFVQKRGYNDYTIEAVDYIKSIDKSFYRVDKNYYSSLSPSRGNNDSKVQGFHSTPSYASFNNSGYFNFSKNTYLMSDNSELSKRWLPGTRNRLALQTISNVKYVLAKDSKFSGLSGLQKIKSFGDVDVYRLMFPLPFGFCYDKYVVKSDHQKLKHVQNNVTLLNCFVAQDEDLNKFSALSKMNNDSIIFKSILDLKEKVDSLKTDSLYVTLFTDNHIEGNINLDKPKVLYFSIPFDKDWKCEVDGKDHEILIVNYGMSGILLNPGTHQIKLEFADSDIKKGAVITIISFVIFLGLIGFEMYRRKKGK